LQNLNATAILDFPAAAIPVNQFNGIGKVRQAMGIPDYIARVPLLQYRRNVRVQPLPIGLRRGLR
jgi:hypothetical protein